MLTQHLAPVVPACMLSSDQGERVHRPLASQKGRLLRLVCAGSLGRGHGAEVWAYRLAHMTLASDVPLPALAPLRIPLRSVPLQASTAGSPRPIGSGGPRVVAGWVAGDTRAVACAGEAGRYDVEIAGIGLFSVDADSGWIRCDGWRTAVGAERFEEVLLGPPVALLLAGRDTWCLHASAVLFEGHALLFLGPSGCGKSTLAAHCAQHTGLLRLADDILPCALVDGAPSAQPSFPQLKLPEAAQYPSRARGSVPIGALVFLDPAPVDGPVAVEVLAIRAAMKRLVDQTVAVGLFDRWLHQKQLRFLSRLISSIPAFLLHYPHERGRLPEVRDAVTELARRCGATEGPRA